MGRVWGSMRTDYITKLEGACGRCHQQKYMCHHLIYLCAADNYIKSAYDRGRTQDAIALLRSLPTEALKDYLPEERRTPAELVAVILDELEQRGDYEKPQEAMRL